MLVSRFLIERLENAGVRHVFGLPGEYNLDLYKELWDNKSIHVVNNTDELFSGYAADAYARVKGIGCVVTHTVAASKILGAIQCAYVERSPVIVIAGAPAIDEEVRMFGSQKSIFESITCASVLLGNPSTAGFLIDQSFEALDHYKQPIYLELPYDVGRKPISYDVYKQGTPVRPKTESDSLDEALAEVCDKLLHSERPAILAGVELDRCGLGAKLVKFVERFNVPVATTLLSKSLISERHPLFAGIYSGKVSEDSTRQIIEGADCLLVLGVTLPDSWPRLRNKWLISASIKSLRIRNHTYTNVQFVDFCDGLFKTSEVVIAKKADPPTVKRSRRLEFEPQPNTSVTRPRLFQKINAILMPDMAMISDMGDALCYAGGLIVDDRHFLGPTTRATLGWAIPAAVGVQTAKPQIRPIVVLGDAAFQTSFAELSTILDRRLNPIIFVLNNDGYTTERILAEGDFNKVRKWDYHKFSELLGGGQGVAVETEDDLEQAVKSALDSKTAYVINVRLKKQIIQEP